MREQAFCRRLHHVGCHVHVAVVPCDAGKGVSDLRLGAFEPLQVDVGPTDQGPGDVVPEICAPGIHETAVQHARVKTEGARAVDGPEQTHDVILFRLARCRPSCGTCAVGSPCQARNAISRSSSRQAEGASSNTRSISTRLLSRFGSTSEAGATPMIAVGTMMRMAMTSLTRASRRCSVLSDRPMICGSVCSTCATRRSWSVLTC